MSALPANRPAPRAASKGKNMPLVATLARALCAGLLLAAAGAAPSLSPWGAGQALAQTRGISIDPGEIKHGGELVVPINKSQILRVDQPFKELLVGNAEIADVMALTDQSIYVLGKGLGTTNLTLYGPKRNLIAIVDLVVSYDVDALKAKLFEIMPNEKIEVRGLSGAISLGGIVSNASDLARAMDVAERYAPGKVSNHMRVGGSQQVMLEVKFAEVERSLTKNLRLNNGVTFNDASTAPTVGQTAFDIVTGSTSAINPGLVGAGAFAASRYLSIDLFFQAAEEKGASRTLAEPTLIAVTGETANFLAGGEYPYPVPQGNGEITIQYKQFGVALAFTPTVLQDGVISMVVAPEVSTLDFSTPLQIQGSVIPALKTRRAKTTVELRDGQSFAIAGLLLNDFSDLIAQVPWLGDVPVLGVLFRSPQFTRRETELVIVVTPRLAKPAKAGTLALPTDKFVAPSDVELFFLGQTAGSVGGGMTGTYGHSIK
jgi:pilus assembly protein CpaC